MPHQPSRGGIGRLGQFTSATATVSQPPLGLAPLKENNVLETLIVVLVVLWLLGLVSSYTLGGFIHVLLVLAIIVLLLRVFRGNKIL